VLAGVEHDTNRRDRLLDQGDELFRHDEFMRVLVTGAAGRRFLSHTLQVLANIHSIVGLDLSEVGDLPDSVDWVTGDVADRALVSSATSADGAFPTNVVGTYNVFDCARQHGVRRVILLSQAPVHFSTDNATRPVWRSSSGPDHLYDLTKRLQEEIARDFSEMFGLELVVIRWGHVVDAVAGVDPDGNSLADADYCRDGWVCCHDVANDNPRRAVSRL
jgi:nucleoside-diphosphate-sugar epimerase